MMDNRFKAMGTGVSIEEQMIQLQKKTEVGSAQPRLQCVDPGEWLCPRCGEKQDKQLPHWCSHDHRAGLD